MRIAMTGTFDVDNYGDNLFPLLAKHELGTRLPGVEIDFYSYEARATPSWPYAVCSLTEFPKRAREYDGVIVGGGDVIRFDKDVADGYLPPVDWIHHPTGYWLAPSLFALQHGIPLVWNAPGCVAEAPVWAKPLVELIVRQGSYISVRDRFSLRQLVGANQDGKVKVVPDSAFGIAQLIDSAKPSDEFRAACLQYGIEKPYLVIQAAPRYAEYLEQLAASNPGQLERYQRVLLPIGPDVGDLDDGTNPRVPGAVRLPFFRNPMLLAEFIAHAEAALGHSLHLSITALAHGVPVFSSATEWDGKYASLLDSNRVYPFPIEGKVYSPWFLKRVGKQQESPGSAEKRLQVAAHWDAVAATLQSGRKQVAEEMNRFWFTLPAALEQGFARRADPPVAGSVQSWLDAGWGRYTPRRIATGLGRRLKRWA